MTDETNAGAAQADAGADQPAPVEAKEDAPEAVTEVAAAPATSPVNMAIQDVGGLLGALFNTVVAKRLGPAAPIAEDVASGLLGDFETWLEGKL